MKEPALSDSGSRLSLDFDPHLPGGASNDPDRRVFGAGIKIPHFPLSDFGDLFFGELANLGFVGLLGTGGNIERLLDQDGGRRLLCDEGEALVLVDSDHHREDVAGLLLSGGVEFLTERHDVHPVLTERWPDRRSGVRGSCWDLELDGCDDFFCHDSVSLNC